MNLAAKAKARRSYTKVSLVRGSDSCNSYSGAESSDAESPKEKALDDYRKAYRDNDLQAKARDELKRRQI